MAKNKLTDKQDRFCKEFVVCMNASQAYRKAFDCSKMKPESVNRKAFELKNTVKIRSRIEELKSNVEEALGISKAKIVKDMVDIFEATKDSEDEKGVAVQAGRQISKMMGYDAPVKFKGNLTLDQALSQLQNLPDKN
jgi:phage terminase small subunit